MPRGRDPIRLIGCCCGLGEHRIPALWNVPQLAHAACTGGPQASFDSARLFRDGTAEWSLGRKGAWVRRPQLGEQAACRGETARLEPLGKLSIDGSKHIVRLPAAADSLP